MRAERERGGGERGRACRQGRGPDRRAAVEERDRAGGRARGAVTTETQPLLRDLIDIPEQVTASDLVTELASAVHVVLPEGVAAVDDSVAGREQPRTAAEQSC